MATPSDAQRRQVERVTAICQRVADERSLRIAVIEEIRRHVAFDFYAWLLTDPETTVGSAPLASTPSLADLPRLVRAKYLTTVNRWTALDGVATLSAASGGERARSLVWRDVLSSYGVGDVASMVFRDQHGCWAFLDLWRVGDSARFSTGEVDLLHATLEPITEGLRLALATTFDNPPLTTDRRGPVMLMLSPTLDVRAQTPEADAFLRTLVPPGGDGRPVPAGAYNVAAQLLALEAGVDDHLPNSRVHLRDGAWLTLRAARVADHTPRSAQDITVSIEPCSPAERRTLYSKVHALTARETELVERLALGADTRTLAAELHMSEHTVQDHLKAIFAKTGTRNRRTLLTRITGQ